MQNQPVHTYAAKRAKLPLKKRRTAVELVHEPYAYIQT
jgi:hypothetical protein